jgi:hypothetical protein
MSSPITYCFSSPLKPLMLRLIRVSSCNSSSSTLLSRISLWFRRLLCCSLQSALCSTPSFSLVFVLVRFRHLSSQCLLCYLHCRFCCLLLAPRHFLVVVGDHSVSLPSSSLSFDAFSFWLHELCILFGFLLPALQHLSFLWPIDSWGRRSLTLFTLPC